MNPQEKRIKEQRTMEASRDNLMGTGGKIGTIAQIFGDKIIVHGNGNISYLQDVWEIPDEDEDAMPIMEDDPFLNVMGWVWDGLRQRFKRLN